jgi:GNAT superfamily N-acetyltransferase
LGAPDPETFWSDRDYLHSRWHAPHVASFGAHLREKFVGSNFATRWGSVGFFGPITVRPDLQEGGIAQALLARTMEQFDAWNCTHTGLFTFAQSAALAGCREVAESIYPGLDLTEEIRSAHAQSLGDTMLVEGHGRITAFAICHYGPKSEAGADTCFVKFGAVRDTAIASADYQRLLDSCESPAVAVGMPTVLAGTNLAQQEAYEALAARGYRTAIQGVNMHRRNEPGYCRPGIYAIDDWR